MGWDLNKLKSRIIILGMSINTLVSSTDEDYASKEHEFLAVGCTFVKKLHMMVCVEADDIIEWGADGTYFEIKDSRRLEVEVLPKYFRLVSFSTMNLLHKSKFIAHILKFVFSPHMQACKIPKSYSTIELLRLQSM